MAVDIIARGMAASADEKAGMVQSLVVEEYDPTQTYNPNNIVFYDGKLYLCVGTNVTGTFDPTQWQQIVISDELTEIINKLATMTNPMIIKGRVDTVNDLPVDAEVGWVYFVGLVGASEMEEYVYTDNNTWEYIGTSQIMVDDALSDVSTNPVQNKVITKALNTKYNKEDDVAISMAQYQALGDEKYYDGKNYYIYDADTPTSDTIIYGWHVDPDESDPAAAITYLEDAVGMTPAAMGSTTFSYGSWENAFFMPKPCMLKSNGTVDYYLDTNDYRKKANAQNLVVGKIEHANLQSDNGKIFSTSSQPESDIYELDIAPIQQGITYTISVSNIETGIIYGIFSTYPTMGSIPYNSQRTVIQNTYSYTFTAPINGYIAFRDKLAEPLALMVSGSTKGSSDIYDTTYDGNVMIEWPLIFWKYEAGSAEGEGYFYVSNRRVDDSFNCWCNYDADGNIIPHFYTAAYNGLIYNDKQRSISGYALVYRKNLSDYRDDRTYAVDDIVTYEDLQYKCIIAVSTPEPFDSTKWQQIPYCGNTTTEKEVNSASANNTTTKQEWYIDVWADRMLINGLIVLMGKSLDTQSVFGKGISQGLFTQIQSYVTGALNDKGFFYGDISDGTVAVKVFGMENYWGGMYRRTAGLKGTGTGYAYKLTYSTVDGSSAEGYYNSPNLGYIPVTLTKPNNGYIVKQRYGVFGCLPASTTSGSSSTYYADMYYKDTEFAGTGGIADQNNSGLAGCFALATTARYSFSGGDIASCLSCKPLKGGNQ